jgi:hypothetical protein
VRTTIDIPDAKYRLLKSMHGVDIVLSGDKTTRQRRLKLPIIRSKHPATLEIDNERIYDLIGFP